MKKFYGVRFLGGNRTCTTGTPNETTGNLSVACDVQVFRSISDRNAWVNRQDMYAPTGANGGERIAATKEYCRRLRQGDTVELFEEELEMAEMLRYDD